MNETFEYLYFVTKKIQSLEIPSSTKKIRKNFRETLNWIENYEDKTELNYNCFFLQLYACYSVEQITIAANFWKVVPYSINLSFHQLKIICSFENLAIHEQFLTNLLARAFNFYTLKQVSHFDACLFTVVKYDLKLKSQIKFELAIPYDIRTRAMVWSCTSKFYGQVELFVCWRNKKPENFQSWKKH